MAGWRRSPTARRTSPSTWTSSTRGPTPTSIASRLPSPPLAPYLRGAPEGLPFRFDPPTIRGGLNFTLVTSAGDLDVLGEATGAGTYENLIDRSVMRRVFDLDCRFVDLPTLIHLKRSAGRPKDLERIAELEALLEETEREA